VGRLALDCPDGPSDTGAFTLSWFGPPAGTTYRLSENGATIYEGPARATTVSGRGEGRYEYSLETVGAPGAESCVVLVQPPAISTAMVLFVVGLGVFLATLTLIIRGHRTRGREEPRS
jgi:hypothetical protein